MSPDVALITRDVRLAILFGPPRLITADESTAFHGALREALSADDIAFRYNPPDPGSVQFKAEYQRVDSGGTFTSVVSLDSAESPLQLFFGQTGSDAATQADDRFESAVAAFFSSIPAAGEWERVKVETRILAECSNRAGSRSAAELLEERLMRIPAPLKDALGPNIPFLSYKLETHGGYQDGDDPLDHPKTELSLEVLREKPSSVYAELVCHWPHAPTAVTQDPTFISQSFARRPIQESVDPYMKDMRHRLGTCIRALCD